MIDHYKILKIDYDCSQQDIKKAYRKLAHLYHPDKGSDDSKQFLLIKDAYDILYDEEARRTYDLQIRKKVKKKKATKYSNEFSENDRFYCGRVKKVFFKKNIFYILLVEIEEMGSLEEYIVKGTFFDKIIENLKVEIFGEILFDENRGEYYIKAKKTKIIIDEIDEYKELVEMLNEDSKSNRSLAEIKKYYLEKGYDYVFANIKYSLRKVKPDNTGDITGYLVKSLLNNWAGG